jgi:hypothetical protein
VNWKLACSYALSEGVPQRSLWVALVVGTILNLINQGGTLLGGHRLDFMIWRRAGSRAVAALTIRAVFLTFYIAMTLAWEDFAYVDNSLFTL